MVVESNKGPIDRDHWIAIKKKMAEDGTTVTLQAGREVEPNVVVYKILLTKRDGQAYLQYSKMEIKDGKIYRVTPIDGDVYSCLVNYIVS